jgi:hypothetical protein
MTAASLLTALLVLLIFKLTSRPSAIRRSRNRVTARVLELLLFRDDVRVSLGAVGRVWVANLSYLRRVLVPFLAAVLPMLWILSRADPRLGSRPLRPGETTLATARFRDGVSVLAQTISLEGSGSVTVDSPPVRIPARGEVSWRLRAGSGAGAAIRVHTSGKPFTFDVATGGAMVRARAARSTGGPWLTLAGLARLPPGGPVAALTVDYPRRDWMIAGRSWHWLAVFFVLTLLFGYALKKPLRVEV